MLEAEIKLTLLSLFGDGILNQYPCFGEIAKSVALNQMPIDMQKNYVKLEANQLIQEVQQGWNIPVPKFMTYSIPLKFRNPDKISPLLKPNVKIL